MWEELRQNVLEREFTRKYLTNWHCFIDDVEALLMNGEFI